MTPHQEFLKREAWSLSGGGFWARGLLPGGVGPDQWEARPARVLILRLSTYEDTALSFTHNLLYSLADQAGLFPDLGFLPPPRDAKVFTEAGLEWVFGVRSGRSWRDFDLIAVSNALIQELGNLGLLFQQSGIPLTPQDRRRTGAPLVILGGANASCARVLMGEDSWVDGIFLGEEDGAVQELFQSLVQLKAQGRSREEILEAWRSQQTLLDPANPGEVKIHHRQGAWNPRVYTRLLTNGSPGNYGKAVLPLSEGCEGFCSFCHESFARKPYRENPLDQALALAREIKISTGATKIDLFSFNFNRYQDLWPLVEALVQWYPQIGLKSQRMDSLTAHPGLVALQKVLGKQTFTVGLEGISENLRTYLNKNLSEAQVRSAFQVLAREGVREVKVFLIATGREKPGDYQAFEALLEFLKGLPTPSGHPLKLNFSVTPLVRFPHTPLEQELFPGTEVLQGAVDQILQLAEQKNFSARQAAGVEEAWYCDRVLRSPSLDHARAWRTWILSRGFIYYNEIPASVSQGLTQAWESLPNPGDSPLWQAWSLGLKREFLDKQHQDNLQGRQTPFPADRLVPAPRDLVQKISAVLQTRQKSQSPLTFRLTWSQAALGIPPLARWTYFMALLGPLAPDLALSFRGWLGSSWAGDPESPCQLWGDEILTGGFFLTSLWEGSSELWDRVSRDSGGLFQAQVWSGPPEPPGEWVIQSPGALDEKAALLGLGLKFTLVKREPQTLEYRFSPDSVKKKQILSLEASRAEGQWIYRLTPGVKFSLEEFLRRGFGKLDRGASSRITPRFVLKP